MTTEQQQAIGLVPRQGHEQAQYYCSTARQTFQPLSLRYETVCGHLFVWVYCPLCDAKRRTRADGDFDALHPQPHCYELIDQEPTA